MEKVVFSCIFFGQRVGISSFAKENYYLMKKILLLPLIGLSTAIYAQMKYPETRKVEQIDVYHGVQVSDPYRWLEDDRSPETEQWVKAQNALTQKHLDQIPFRTSFLKRLQEVYNYPKYSAPTEKGGWNYFYKNDGLQNQYVLYRQKGEIVEKVLDPNTLSKDGTTGLAQFVLNKGGSYAAYALTHGGSDWQTVYLMDMKNLQTMGDTLKWVKVSGLAWEGDGFYYSRYPQPEGSALAAVNENHQVWYHRLGTSQDQDHLIYENKEESRRFHYLYTSEDEDLAFLSISDRGKGLKGNALYYKRKGEKNFSPIIAEVGNSSYSVVYSEGDELIIQTNDQAPNDKLLSYNLQSKAWKEIVPERKEPMVSVSTAGRKLFVAYLKDVTTKVERLNLQGQLEEVVQLPGVGTAGGFQGKKTDEEVFYYFTSFTNPSTTYIYNLKTGKSTRYRKPEVKFDPEAFVTEQVFYVSKDGTKVPMFITYKKGTPKNGKNPTLLYGYGGFNVTLQPAFSAMLIPFLEEGGVYAQANIRGGGEYGESWHEQGTKLKKQNVYDDFIAAAEYLIQNKFCDNEHLALRGASNGGLLVGAVVNQRPDLAKVAIPEVGVMDMLRFHKFTIGWNWVADYGSADNPEEFKAIYAYSPMHNIREGVNYPATLITTADHDDRVVPAHSFKYAATLQEKAGKSGKNPLLIRVETQSGHGSSNTQKMLELTADIYGFIFYHTGVQPFTK